MPESKRRLVRTLRESRPVAPFMGCWPPGGESPRMKYRTYPNSDVTVSEVGFGLWTTSTGWWGEKSDDDAVAMLRAAHDLGITLYDAADTYGNGRSEEQLAAAFAERRDRVVYATKFGYDFSNSGDSRRGQSELRQDFSTAFVRRALEASLRRLHTDYIDIYQMHNARMAQIEDDALWELLESFKSEGKIRTYGVALGPAIGWLFDGIEKVAQLRFLERTDRTLGQAAIAWLLGEPRVMTVLPNIYDREQLAEFAAAPDAPGLTADETARIAALYAENFGVDEPPMAFKGSMSRDEPVLSGALSGDKG